MSQADRCASGCTNSAPDFRHLEIRHQHRRSQRGRRRQQPVDHQRRGPRRRASPPAACDAIVVGTGTVFIDDPKLTARLPDGSLADRQPLRVVVGEREISSDANVLNDDTRTMVIRTRDPHEVIKAPRIARTSSSRAVRRPGILRAGVIDRILAYVAPILLGGPITAVDDVGVLSIARTTLALRRDRAHRPRHPAQSDS